MMRRQGGAEVEEGGGQISKGRRGETWETVGDPFPECRSRDNSMGSIKQAATIRIHWLSKSYFISVQHTRRLQHRA
jgi:hypothetical protein